MEHDFPGRSSRNENFREQQNAWKGSPVFLVLLYGYNSTRALIGRWGGKIFL